MELADAAGEFQLPLGCGPAPEQFQRGVAPADQCGEVDAVDAEELHQHPTGQDLGVGLEQVAGAGRVEELVGDALDDGDGCGDALGVEEPGDRAP
ncbi:hypothetical protein ACPCAE_00835 [Streptomyces cinereoruber]|uniref:hypothetical protein n=1 Tax=Streptomyces TaxID=1883 RepID=UPI001EF5D598|nr:hypothetical protein [Streptomyces sp. CS081A]